MLNKILKNWKDVSIPKKLYFVVGIMALLIIVELLTLRFAMGKLSAVRAFVGGEGLWTKGQKQGIYQLQRYVLTQDKKDYEGFKESLKVNEGDHIARMELMNPHPDMRIVRDGFIQGGIHPDDIDPMVDLLTRFHKVSYISEAVAAWTLGDQYIDELKTAGEEYNKLISSGKMTRLKQLDISNKIQILNEKLSIVTAKFSLVLGEGSRWMENLVLMILFSLVLTVECVGLTLTFFTSRSISRGLKSLITVSNKIGEGEFDQRLEVESGDEIGQLTQSVNNMGELLQKTYADLEQKIRERTLELCEIAVENKKLFEDAKNAVKMRDQFLSIASHELRTPITALHLHLQYIAKQLNNSKEEHEIGKIKEYIQRGIVMSRRISNLQDVMMDLTYISVGKIEIKKEKHDLVSIAKEAITQLGLDSQKSDQKINLHAPASLEGDFDSVRLGQVVINLLTNAIKYGNKMPIDLIVELHDGVAQIKVKDNGPGIPEEKRALIFERFERANTDPSVSGLGLGLYISQQIVLAHEGKIIVESELGQGSTFKVILPCS